VCRVGGSEKGGTGTEKAFRRELKSPIAGSDTFVGFFTCPTKPPRKFSTLHCQFKRFSNPLNCFRMQCSPHFSFFFCDVEDNDYARKREGWKKKKVENFMIPEGENVQLIKKRRIFRQHQQLSRGKRLERIAAH
jgi:hypothetical protein